jgi:hypothetical protein
MGDDDQWTWNQFGVYMGVQDMKYPEYELSKKVENLREKEKHMADELRKMRWIIYDTHQCEKLLASLSKCESK